MSNTDQRLQVILSVVLAKVTSPAIVLVTAASPCDDSTLLARGLTAAAKDTGHSAVLVSLEDFSHATAPVVLKDVERSIAERAARNDIVFVDAPSLLNTPFAVRLAQTAAGTILALAGGRKVMSEDKRAAELLQLVGATFLGIVTTPLRPTTVKLAEKKVARLEPSPVVARVKSSLP
jgi:hypothetical protein